MKMKYAISALYFFVAGSVIGQQAEWSGDVSHSQVGFSVRHMVISNVKGGFNDFALTVKSSKDDFSDSQISLTIQMASINTANEKRDDHLRNEDFFDVKKFPEMKFTSTNIEKLKGNKYKLTGDLTMMGKSKSITLDVELGGVTKDPWGNTRAGFSLAGELDRRDYGITWSKNLDTGGLVVGNMVKINCDIELVKKK